MTRVVHVGFHLDRNRREPDALLAAWPTLTDTASAVARAGFDVTVVQPAHRDAELDRDGVLYRFVSERPAVLRRGTPGTRAVRAPAAATVGAVAAAAPDVVHVNGLSVPAPARRLRERLPHTPIVVQDHGDRPPSPWRRPAARRAMDAVDAVAFTAAPQADPFFAVGVFPPGLPVHEVPESSTAFTPGDRDRARRETGLHGDPCLLWVGHLDRNKDPLTVLEGFAMAAPDLPDARLWMCYRNAPLLRRVEAALEALPTIRERVRLLGEQPHRRVETLLRAADALVSGSHREGSGYAVIEAMACGTTPVVTDIPSFRSLAGPVGALWEPGDARSLAAALVDLGGDLDSPTRRDRVRRHFEGSLSWDVVGRRLADVYAGLLADATRDRAGAG